MKFIFTCLSIIVLSFGASAQLFEFDDTVTVLKKNTDQSPAHWYIEITSLAAEDTTLRWKAEFTDIPEEWEISFDTQGTYTTSIQDGDSADFTLKAPEQFKQKLIIGAALNNTPGKGTARFLIYDPNNVQDQQRIYFIFEVGYADLGELDYLPFSITKSGLISLTENEIEELALYDFTGRKLRLHRVNAHQWQMEDMTSQALIIHLKVAGKTKTFKTRINY